MDSSTFNKLPQSLNHQDTGTMAKKKKERENRNSITNDLLVDWSQKDMWVTITIVTGPNHDYKKAIVDVEDFYVSVTLADGRRYATKLFGQTEPQCTETSQKASKFIIKLLKHDPSLHWTSLTPTAPASHNNKNHNNNNNNINQNKNYNNNRQQPSSTVAENSYEAGDTTSLAALGLVNDSKTADDGKPAEEVVVADQNTVKLLEVKTDFSERDDDNSIIVYIYVKKINKETAQVKFYPKKVVIHFSTSDVKILNSSPGSSESTLFQYTVPLVGTIVPDKCSYSVNNSKMEMKMKKAMTGAWQAISPIDAGPGSKGYTGKTWESAVGAEARHAPIPPAPPAPPTAWSPKLTDSSPKKPTCLVSPSQVSNNRGEYRGASGSSSSGSLYSYGNQTPTASGFMGLDNIGNTCFMNSVLQTLLNTRELRDYFLSPENYSQRELNIKNPLGQGGRLAVAFAVLMKVAWTSNNRSFAPSKLKGVMSLKANQFSGFAQHDAQEFMVELLDGLHEDLNRIQQKPYCAEPPDLDGWSDKDAAAESWRLHKMRNDSVIDDLFKGQFRSALTCHECGKISVKFDEFCCLSVPIPKDQKSVEVLFFYKDTYRRPVRVTVRINADAVLEDLTREVGERVKVAPACIALLEAYKHRVQKVFQRGCSLSSITHNDELLAFEVVHPSQVGDEEVVDVCVTQRLSSPSRPTECANCGKQGSAGQRIQRCTKCLLVGYCCTDCQKAHWERHSGNCHFVNEVVGSPFIVSMPRSHATYSNLTRVMEGYARHSVDIFQPPVAAMTNAAPAGGAASAASNAGRQQGKQKQAAASTRRKTGSTSSVEEEEDDLYQEKMETESGGGYDRMSAGEDEERRGEKQYDDDIYIMGGEMDRARPSTVINDWGSGGLLDTADNKRASSEGRGSVCAVPPLVPFSSAATQLFTICPVSSRGQSLPNTQNIADAGDEPLDLDNMCFLAMDWKTNSAHEVVCLVKNKEIECEPCERSVSSVAAAVGGGGGYRSRSHQQSTTLQACMDLFTQPENLSEGDSWRCPRCKKPVEATKQMSLWRLPPVLIVQLKRFSFKYVLYSDKIDKFVQYPVRGFDVAPHMALGGGDGQSTQYDLYGVVNHMGRLLGGHYTAYARLLQQHHTQDHDIDWRLFDDSRVSEVTEDRVVNDQAYLLLYRRRDTPFSLPPAPPSPAVVDAATQQQHSSFSGGGGGGGGGLNNNTVLNDNITTALVPPPPSPQQRNLVYLTPEPVASPISASSSAAAPLGSVVHVPAASAHSAAVSISHISNNQDSAVAAAAVTDVDEKQFDSPFDRMVMDTPPHSNLHNMRIGGQDGVKDDLPLGSLEQDDLISSFDNFYESNATSMINTNDAMCGNFVSNINIDGSSSAGAAAAGAVGDGALPRREAVPPGELKFSAQSGFPGTRGVVSRVAADSFVPFAGASSVLRSGTAPPTSFLPGPSTGDASKVTLSDQVFGFGQQPHLAADDTADSPSYPSSGDGAVLDVVTPMSVSTTSQPSLSSTEEESVAGPQEELD